MLLLWMFGIVWLGVFLGHEHDTVLCLYVFVWCCVFFPGIKCLYIIYKLRLVDKKY